MLTEKLNPCANLLYHWLLIHHRDNQGIIFEPSAFQVWSSEFIRHSLTQDEVIDAISTLKRLKIITYNQRQFFLQVKEKDINPEVNKLPVSYFFELNKYRQSKKEQHWGLIFVAILFALWGGCFWLSLRMTDKSSPRMIIPGRYHVFVDN